MVNTDIYLALGLTVIIGIVVFYAASLALRFRQANKLIETLETLQEQR